MVFNDVTGGQGIVQDAYYEAGANSVSYPIADVVRNANLALDEVVTIILGADGKWQFDDSNATDLPIGETDMISGQDDYSFDAQYLVIAGMEIKDPNGNWVRLTPVDRNDLNQSQAISTLYNQTGIPQFYDKQGESFFFIPTPNYNYRLVEEGASGIRVFFQRKIAYFTISSTTTEPGFGKHLHKYISLYVANAYCRAKELVQREQALLGQLNIWAEKIRAFYSYRELDTEKRIKNKIVVKR